MNVFDLVEYITKRRNGTVKYKVDCDNARHVLNMPNKMIAAITHMAKPVLSYGFCMIAWPQNESKNIDLKTRKIR